MCDLVADFSFLGYFKAYDRGYFESVGIANPYQPADNILIVLEAIQKSVSLAGDIVECGVYRGRSLATIGLLVKEMGLQKTVWGLDSFEGFPGASEEDKINGILPDKTQKDYWADTSLESVLKGLRHVGVPDVVRCVQGFFHDILDDLPVQKISVLFLDCDLFESYMVCLSYLYPRISVGGYIIFDEYFSPVHPGARKAVDQFFADKIEKPIRADSYLKYGDYERWYLMKK